MSRDLDVQLADGRGDGVSAAVLALVAAMGVEGVFSRHAAPVQSYLDYSLVPHPQEVRVLVLVVLEALDRVEDGGNVAEDVLTGPERTPEVAVRHGALAQAV